MRGYKAFEQDWTCRGKQYEVGKEYTEDGPLELCGHGMHFCEKLADCFEFYAFAAQPKVAEVEALGEVLTDGKKSCTDKLRIIREVPWDEVLRICNTGDWNTGNRNTGNRNTGNWNTGNRNTGNWNTGNWNTGDCNTGDWNTGNCNTGDCNTGNRNTGDWNTGDWNTGNRNTGDCNTGNRNTGNCNTGNRNTGNRNTGNRNTGNWNTGDCNTGNRNTGDRNTGDWNTGNCNTGDCNTGNWNTGDWNTGDWNTGIFCTETPKINCFDKPSTWSIYDWRQSGARNVLYQMPRSRIIWMPLSKMSPEQRKEHKTAETMGGYLKYETHTDRQTWWDGLTDRERHDVLNLPNFDPVKFKTITGIQV